MDKTKVKYWGQVELPVGPIRKRMINLGLSRQDAYWLMSKVKRWLDCNGPRGYLETIARQTLAWKQYHSGDYVSIPGCSRFQVGTQQIPVHTRCLSRYSAKVSLRVLRLLKNIVTYENVSVAQWSKFHDSAVRPDPDFENLWKIQKVVVRGAQYAPENDRVSWEMTPPLTDFITEEGKKTFCPFNAAKSIPRDPSVVLKDSLRLLHTNSVGYRYNEFGDVVHPDL